MLEKYFELKKHQTSVRQELRAGLTTFLAMSYILFVNPNILESAIMVPSSKDLIAGTAFAAAFGSIVMGLWARMPFAMAPGMGLNAFFAFTMVGAQGLSWQVALGCVFISGALFLLISLLGLRSMLLDAIPYSLKIAISCGIGLFIAFIGLKTGGVIISSKATLVQMGPLTSPQVVVTAVGLLLTVVMMIRGIKGAMLYGIIGATIFAIATASEVFGGGQRFAGWPQGVMTWPMLPIDTMFKLDILGALSASCFIPIVTLLFVDFFDTAGTLFGLAEQTGRVSANGKIPRSKQAFAADGLATIFSSLVGTSPTTTYVESATGVGDGGRTGLTAVFVGVFFILSVCFANLMSVVPAAATAPALIIVGALMMKAVVKVPWNDLSEAIPAFLLMIIMPLTYSISNGIGVGILVYVALSLVSGKLKKLNPILVGLASLILAKFIFLG